MNNVHPLRTYPAGNAPLIDVVRHAIQTGQRLVTNGTEIYLTPFKRPGEFDVAVRVVEPVDETREAA